MAVEVEAAPDGTRRRPGDILIPGWRDGKPLAVDFAITATADLDAADRIAQTKNRAYRGLCLESGRDFTPVVGDAFGAVRADGAVFLGRLCKRLAEKKEKGWPTTQTMFWQTVSTCLVRRAAGAIADAWANGITTQLIDAVDEGGTQDDPANEDWVWEQDGTVDSEFQPLGGAGVITAQPLTQEMEGIVS